MKRLFLSLFMVLMFGASTFAQHKLNGHYFNKELYMNMRVALDGNKLPVPGLEVDSCYGYLQGNINGSWIFMRIKEKTAEKAIVRAISERGADAQDLELTLTPEGNVSVRQLKDAYIKGIAKNRYVKLPKNFVLEKQ